MPSEYSKNPKFSSTINLQMHTATFPWKICLRKGLEVFG